MAIEKIRMQWIKMVDYAFENASWLQRTPRETAIVEWEVRHLNFHLLKSMCTNTREEVSALTDSYKDEIEEYRVWDMLRSDMQTMHDMCCPNGENCDGIKDSPAMRGFFGFS